MRRARPRAADPRTFRARHPRPRPARGRVVASCKARAAGAGADGPRVRGPQPRSGRRRARDGADAVVCSSSSSCCPQAHESVAATFARSGPGVSVDAVPRERGEARHVRPGPHIPLDGVVVAGHLGRPGVAAAVDCESGHGAVRERRDSALGERGPRRRSRRGLRAAVPHEVTLVQRGAVDDLAADAPLELDPAPSTSDLVLSFQSQATSFVITFGLGGGVAVSGTGRAVGVELIVGAGPRTARPRPRGRRGRFRTTRSCPCCRTRSARPRRCCARI